eukprot:TRINITY_DN3482_c0_g1_i1.p1 TRINITY_DN3482_c0_g1~~TRINITY_DN3482_c0_g1_i1.p1  ORF type:complete len:114 (-),score=29.29 TRINITY_DN3482_c0_g1_i1:279-620(-)
MRKAVGDGEDYCSTLAALTPAPPPDTKPDQRPCTMSEKWVFHGCPPHALRPICDKGLLPYSHPLNRSHKVDDGWFGSGSRGIYVSNLNIQQTAVSSRLIANPLPPSPKKKNNI